MQIRIICAGKLKEAYYREAAGEYARRIGRFVPLEVEEVADERIPESFSPAQERIAVEKEGRRILERIGAKDHVIALCIEGKMYDSVGFASRLNALTEEGTGRVAFVIGGSSGLSGEVLERSDERISLSRMTFPHRIARILLLEQIYRAFKILRHETYHK